MAAMKSAVIFVSLLASSATANMDDMMSVVDILEQKPAGAAAGVRGELIEEIRQLREAKMGEAQPDLRQQLREELQTARAQELEKSVSPLRRELLSELRSARAEEQAAAAPSPTRQELLAELRAARRETVLEESKLAAGPSSALRQDIVADLRAAREQESKLAAGPSSALRQDIVVADLRAAAREQEVDRDESEPASNQDVYNTELLPWSDEEELLQVEPEVVAQPTAVLDVAKLEAFNRLLRTLVLSSIALGLASAAKLPEFDLKRAGQLPSQWITLALFAAPLFAVSADYMFVMDTCNDLALIVGCWSLAALAALHMRNETAIKKDQK
eukprot:TRINITY_DN26558_c0_g1_i1.p1 TRINITY_DN26558_c0_g1~~TRINITY_DN26558_c0_g1_i1.p1  ORF type:complete len:355 (-),score=111.15 TRINITY_DN26558_c0_g1_i1:70-1059(-)